MTGPRLKSVSIQNFRSIEGDINVQLDAPVVLIHGQNGAGKTSLLSAIELALTGGIPSLERAERNYLEYLPHKRAKDGKGRIELEVSGLKKPKTSLTVTKTTIEKTHLLDRDTGRFFSERCYLAQSTLSRLLELYEGTGTDTRKSDSRLTSFVKELLGLDQFDAIIEGLKPVGDVRRLRGDAPAFWSAREDIPEIEREIRDDRLEEKSLTEERKDVYDRLLGRIALIFGEAPRGSLDLDAIEKLLADNNDESDLVALARARRDVNAILEQWRGLATSGSVGREAIEDEDVSARAMLEAWREGPGRTLNAIIEELRAWMPQLATVDSVGPERAHRAALDAVTNELGRISAIITRDDNDAKAQADADRIIERGRARLPTLDEQIAQAAGANESLAEALSELAPHIHDDACPVCGRDFSEVLVGSLASHVSARIAELVATAGRLQTLTADKATTQSAILAAERNLGAIQSRRLPNDELDDLKLKRARFEELMPQLENLQKAARDGDAAAARVAQAARQLAQLRTNDQAATVLRQSVDKLAEQLDQTKLAEAEGIDAGVARLKAHVENRENTLGVRAANHRAGLGDIEDWKRLDLRLGQIKAKIEASTRRVGVLRLAKLEADRRIELAKELARHTREQRTGIVRRVFNDELNSVWGDLFVRLAPEEYFVPAFALPETSAGPVEAVLETRYRLGGKGGNPRAMLSAGNLNTAALTLFLALHLSAKMRLPWLVIDDPVQSMDEVHISQFAALLRALSKQMNRQVIIAVHERPLFDYLALELSPAFAEDRLITVELSKAANGKTIVRWDTKTYVPDRAIAA